MNLISKKLFASSPKEQPLNGFTQEMIKGLCFNCDHQKSCTWKEHRKLVCEHFE